MGDIGGTRASSSAAAASGAGAAASSCAAYPKKRQRIEDSSDDEEEREDGANPQEDKRASPDLDDGPTECGYVGSYADLIGKHLLVCELHPVECPQGCGERVLRKNLARHAGVCTSNFQACGICGELVKPDDMPAHR